MEKKYQQILYKLSKKSFLKNDIPISAIVINRDNKIIGKAHNTRNYKNNLIGHAEILALNKAVKKNKSWKLYDCTIISTFEPCMMCLGAIQQSKIKNIIYFYDEPKYGFLNSNHFFDSSKFNIQKHKNNIKEYDYTDLMKKFFQNLRKKKI